METSAVSICNRALSRIGAQLITALSDTSQNAQHCNVLYEGTRDEVLMLHEWSWAISRVTLSALPTSYTGWDSAFQLPGDCICPMSLVNAVYQEWTVEGDVLLCNESAAELKYVKKISDPSISDPLFTEVLVLRLASKLAGPIKNNKRLEGQLIQEFFFALERARGEDAWHSFEEPETEWWTTRT